MKKISLLICILIVAITSLKAAIVVNVSTPGTLRRTILNLGVNPDTITSLKLTGNINASDFRDLRDSVLLLKHLDLSEVQVKAYGPGNDNPSLPVTGTTPPSKSYADNVIPGESFNRTTRALPLETIILPSGITEIQNLALANLKNLKSVTFTGNALTTLGSSVFMYNTLLPELILPNTITTYGSQCFKGCTSLQSFTIPEKVTSIANLTFQGCTGLKTVNIPTNSLLTSISTSSFEGTTELGTLNIPATITTIDSTAFSNSGASFNVHVDNPNYSSLDGVLYNKAITKLLRCSGKLTTLNIPSSVLTIGGKSFENNSIEKVVISSSVKTISAYAFSNCAKLIVVDNSNAQLDAIGDYAFNKTSNLKTFDFTSSLKSIGNSAFNLSGIESVTLPKSLKVLSSNSFYYCQSLKTAIIDPDCELTTFGTNVFKTTPALQNVTLPSKLKILPQSTFQGSGLTSITLPDSIEILESKAFYFSAGLKNIVLPQKLKTIGTFAFDGCTALENISIPATCTTIDLNAFTRTSATFTVSNANPNYSANGTFLYNKNKTRLLCASIKTSGFVEIPQTVVSTEDYCFHSANLITKIAFPKNLTSFGKNALTGCTGLKAIYIANATPLNLSANTSLFSGVNKAACVLYVPDQEAATAYLAAAVWKTFEQIEAGTFHKFYSLKDLGFGYTLGLSPNGKNLTGIGYSGLYRLRIGVDTTYIKGYYSGSPAAITDNGVITSTFIDSTYMVTTPVGPTPVSNAGVWVNNKWHSLGGGQVTLADMGTSTSWGSAANAISNNGKYVFGMSYKFKKHSQLVPFRWEISTEGNLVDTLTYNYPPSTMQGSRFIHCSSDGSIACGWSVSDASKGGRRAIVFLSPVKYKLLFENQVGEANFVSPNGKYVAFKAGRKTGYYDVEKDTAIFIDTPTETCAITAISDNKVAVGYREWSDALGNMVRKAFYWTEKTGYMEFDALLKRFAPEIQISDPDVSFDRDKVDVPMSISADGLTIPGWSGYNSLARWGWMLKFSSLFDTPERPINLKANTELATRNKVVLTWEIPTDEKLTLKGFNIYRDNVLIKTIASASIKTYTDMDVPAGYPVYNVVATYTDNSESTMSDKATTTIIDSYNLPYSNDFSNPTSNSQSLSNHYFIANDTYNNKWNIHANNGVFKTPCLIFITSGSAVKYTTTSVTTKPFDATQMNKVYMSMIHRIIASVLDGKSDTLYIEVSDDIYGTNWSKVKSYVALKLPTNYTTETIDLTNFVKGKFFRIRLRMAGEDRKSFNYILDNLSISGEIPSNIKELKAKKYKNVYTRINWQDPAGSYGLTYQTTGPFQPIGDEGTPFIAANKFDSIDMAVYKGKYLTSVSAYVAKSGNTNAIPTKLSIVALKGSTMIANEPIESFIPNAWNTFKFKSPVLISADSDFYFGLYVTQHDNAELPLYTDLSVGIADGKANIFSEDEGATWQKLSTYNLLHNWNIIGNVRDEAAVVERDGDVLGYEVYRDGVKLNSGLLLGQEYLDADGLDLACYSVKTMYSTKGASLVSETVCIDYTDVKNLLQNEVSIVPNPISNKFQIRNLNEKSLISIMDLNGRMVFESNSFPGEYLNVENLPKGVYMIKIKTDTKTYEQKLIKL